MTLAPIPPAGHPRAHPGRLRTGPSPILALARALDAEGHRVVHLEIGEPDFPTPGHVVDAGIRALRDGVTRYVAPEGLRPLREAIAARSCERGVPATPEQVVVTSGAKPMLLYALLALATEGDEVLVPDPGYPGYASSAALAGSRAVRYPIVRDGAGDFRVDLGALEASVTPATRVLVLNAPHNPTGMVLDEDTLAGIAAVALRHDLWVVSDEVYAALSYDEAPPRSIASLPGMAGRTIVVDSFSKTYAMTGWRLGYGVMPASITGAVRALVAESTTCAAPFVQHAGIAALQGPQDAVALMRAEYRARRDEIVQALAAIPGIRAATPPGAFYAFANVTGLAGGTSTSAELAERLLREYGVASMPGSAYGRRGEGHLRFSFASPIIELREATRRVAAFAAAVGSGCT